MREGVQPNRAILQSTEDTPGCESRSRIDEDIPQQIDVDRVWRKTLQYKHVFRQLFHRILVTASATCRAVKPCAILTSLRSLDQTEEHDENPAPRKDLRKKAEGTRKMVRTGRSVDAVLIVIAIASRIGAVCVLQSHLVPRSTYEHGEIASNLVAGRGFAIHFLGSDGPTSQQAPLYPAIVAAAYLLGGVETPRSLFLLEMSQSVLGGLLVVGVLRFCRLLAPARPWMAWVAGLVVALHPTLVYAATHVQVATLGATLLIWTLVWAYQTGASRSCRDAVITGSLLGLLALTDPILALSSVGVMVAIWQAGRGMPGNPRRSLGLIALVGIVSLIGISPGSCETPWFTASSWPSRVRSATRSGREIVP